jgi:hypothetical protein
LVQEALVTQHSIVTVNEATQVGGGLLLVGTELVQ